MWCLTQHSHLLQHENVAKSIIYISYGIYVRNCSAAYCDDRKCAYDETNETNQVQCNDISFFLDFMLSFCWW